MSRVKYTAQHQQWIQSHASYLSFPECYQQFRSEFNLDITENAFYLYANKQCGIQFDKRKYTPEQDSWIIANYTEFKTYDELFEKFHTVFNGDKHTQASLREHVTKQLKLQPSYKNIGRFQKNGRNKEQLPIGTIRKNSVGTYIKVQECDRSKFSGYREPYWKPLQKKIYEDAFGELPSDKMVVFLNNDNTDFSLQNLYPIDRRISAILSKNRWWTSDSLLTLAAIRWCELYYQLH